MFGCSTRTVQRRMAEFDIVHNRYSDITDIQLDEMVGSIASRLPSCGIRSVQSMLRVDGVNLQRDRVRESLFRVDPLGLQQRLRLQM